MTERDSRRGICSWTAIDVARISHSAAYRPATRRRVGLDFRFSRSATRQNKTSQGGETNVSDKFLHFPLNRRCFTIGSGRGAYLARNGRNLAHRSRPSGQSGGQGLSWSVIEQRDIAVWAASALLAIGIGWSRYVRNKARNELLRQLAGMAPEQRKKMLSRYNPRTAMELRQELLERFRILS